MYNYNTAVAGCTLKDLAAFYVIDINSEKAIIALPTPSLNLYNYIVGVRQCLAMSSL